MTSVGRCSALLLAFAVMVACTSSPPARPAEAAPEIDPTNPLAGTLLMQQGRALVNEGKIPEGMAKYALALKLQPDNPTLHNLIGMAELQRGNAAKALESFNRALLLAPKYSDALSNRGAAYMQLGQYSLAESDFLSVLSDNTYANRSGVYYNLGSLNFVRGNLAAAEENLRRATREAGPVEAYFLLGQVEERLGKVALAETAYRDAMTRAPERPDVILALATLVEAQGRKGEARELYLKVIAVAPGSPEAHQARVRLE
jgi:tetratricopeptide (TPR) repeat protein